MMPKDKSGAFMPPPCVRLEEAPKIRQAGVVAMTADARSCSLTTARKISIVDKVINRVVDGDAVPAFFYAKDKAKPEEHFMHDLWTLAETAVRKEWERQCADA